MSGELHKREPVHNDLAHISHRAHGLPENEDSRQLQSDSRARNVSDANQSNTYGPPDISVLESRDTVIARNSRLRCTSELGVDQRLHAGRQRRRRGRRRRPVVPDGHAVRIAVLAALHVHKGLLVLVSW